jgi:hypothetical protein
MTLDESFVSAAQDGKVLSAKMTLNWQEDLPLPGSPVWCLTKRVICVA